MGNFLARYLPRVWQQKWHPLSLMLYPLSLLYGLLVTRHRRGYESGQKSVFKADVPVLVVGNVTVGGTGKTPLVVWLANYLRDQGIQLAVISRGYGGQSAVWPVEVTKDQNAENVGDEAMLLRQKITQPIVVAPKRSDSVKLLSDKYPLQLIISDDGLQHLALARDKEIVLVDAERQFGNGRLLPSGPLRQSPESISTEAIMLYTGVGSLKQYPCSMQIEPVLFRHIHDSSRTLPLDAFKDQTVTAVAGIGHPEKFFKSLRQLDIQLKPTAFADHHRFVAEDFAVDEDHPILMTEKDAVKCQQFDLPNAWYLEIQAKPSIEFVNEIDRFINEIKND